MKFIIRPVICAPSGSWSVMIINRPYRSDFMLSSVVYLMLYFSPSISTKHFISTFPIICFLLASRTFMNFPFKGKMPNLLRLTTLIPLLTIVCAESPSVTINVHSSEFIDPASYASSNFGNFEMIREVDSFVFSAIFFISLIFPLFQYRRLMDHDYALFFDNGVSIIRLSFTMIRFLQKS